METESQWDSRSCENLVPLLHRGEKVGLPSSQKLEAFLNSEQSISISLAVGQQPSITFDWAIDRVCEKNKPYLIPDNLRHQLIIHRFATRVSTTIYGNQNSPTGLPAPGEGASLLALLEQEYSDLSREMEEENLSREWFLSNHA